MAIVISIAIEQLCEMSFSFSSGTSGPGGKTMESLYGNGRKLTSFLLTGPVLVVELLQY